MTRLNSKAFFYYLHSYVAPTIGYKLKAFCTEIICITLGTKSIHIILLFGLEIWKIVSDLKAACR